MIARDDVTCLVLAPERRAVRRAGAASGAQPPTPAPSAGDGSRSDRAIASRSWSTWPALERKVAALAAHRSQYALEPDLFPRRCSSACSERSTSSSLRMPLIARRRRRGRDHVRARAASRSAEAEFRSRSPEFDPDGTFAELRRSEYGRLDADGHVYLDYTGGGLHAASQLDAHLDLLRTQVLGNPHSGNPTRWRRPRWWSGPGSSSCEFFNAPPDEYLCIFTANASAALRLVGESYPFGPGGTFALTFDNHNSVNGIREFAAPQAPPSATSRSSRPSCASTGRR